MSDSTQLLVRVALKYATMQAAHITGRVPETARIIDVIDGAKQEASVTGRALCTGITVLGECNPSLYPNYPLLVRE